MDANENPKHYRNNLAKQRGFLKRVIAMHRRENMCYDNLEAELHAVSSELEIMEVELSKDIIYLPEGELEVRSITDILYHEGLHGKAIYEKPKSLGEKIEKRRS